jgi:hypothetical protein
MTLSNQQIVARGFFGFSGIWLGGIGFMWLIHTPTSVPYRVGAGLMLGIAVFVVTPWLIRLAWPLEAIAQDLSEKEIHMSQSSGGSPIVNQGPGSAFSYGQQGGITAGTVNIAPQRAQFSDQLGAQLLSHMPDKNKEVELRTVGSGEDQKVGSDVQIFWGLSP